MRAINQSTLILALVHTYFIQVHGAILIPDLQFAMELIKMEHNSFAENETLSVHYLKIHESKLL
jgi:hypothetical protein